MNQKKSYFSETVDGDVIAEFITDENGNPKFKDGGNHTHYPIRLKLVSGRKDNIRLVVYTLDATYYNPLRESKDAANDFIIDTTSYGDYSLAVDVYLNDGGRIKNTYSLYKLLQDNYAGSNNAAIQSALANIAAN